MDTIPLKRARNDVSGVDPSKCIICQKDTTIKCASTEDGRLKVKDIATLKNDEVLLRIEKLNSDFFVYHVTNKCYKSYTHKKSRDVLQQQERKRALFSNNANVDNREYVENVKTRQGASIRKRAPSTTPEKSRNDKVPCVICGQWKIQGVYEIKGVYEKCRMSESDRALSFLEATIYFQDEVYVRTCDLQDEYAVFGADLYCHKNCIRRYLKKYEEEMLKSGECQKLKTNRKLIFSDCIKRVTPHLQKGEGFSLNDLKTELNKHITDRDKPFENRDISVMLVDYFGNGISFCKPKTVNKSAIVYLKTIKTEDVVGNVASMDVVEDCAKILRESLLNIDFELSDKFCDESDLRESWTNTNIPTPLLKFFSVLFNIKANDETYGDNIDQVDEDDDVDDAEKNESESTSSNKYNRKRRKIQALFQTMYYIVHNGSRKTPLHILNAQSIYEKCKSRDLITSFNHFGMTISYAELQKYHNTMAGLIVETSGEHVPLPSHFDKDGFTMAAFDNFDHEESTLSGVGGSHDTVSVLFQEKPETLHRKPKISKTNVQYGKRIFKEQLSCQNLQEYIKPAKKNRNNRRLRG